MDLEKALTNCRADMQVIPNERRVRETVRRSVETYCSAEEGRLLTCHEFLWTQLGLIRKRWWFFQLLVLLALWAALPFRQGELSAQRLMGAAAALFIILVIPELWRSQTCRSMEIESAAYYSLRQIYAARLLLFGIVDLVLLSLFCWLSLSTRSVMPLQLLIQFILPMTVTACICFGVLCGRRRLSEASAILMCAGWSGIWLLIVLNERIYAAVACPVWLLLLGLALLFSAVAVRRTLRMCDYVWEEIR